VSAVQRARSVERSFQELAERLILRFPSAFELSISSEILVEDVGGSRTQAVVSKLQVLRSMENERRHNWRKLRQACRIALFELGAEATPERVFARIQCRGSHEFNGTESPIVAISKALAAIGHSEQNSCVELVSGI
jgi:hypothetical protein